MNIKTKIADLKDEVADYLSLVRASLTNCKPNSGWERYNAGREAALASVLDLMNEKFEETY